MKIKAFDKFLLRTPLFPIDYIDKLKETPLFEEAIYLSSPDLYESGFGKLKINQRQKNALHKYWRRSCSRCTPFGLFAGCSIGKIGIENNILLVDSNNYKRQSRLELTSQNMARCPKMGHSF